MRLVASLTILIAIITFSLPGHGIAVPVRADTTPLHKAAILEPFPQEFGATAGQPEADALKQAGFQVDIFRGAQVNVPLMEHLGDYSFVYMETHTFTGTLPIIDLGESADDLVNYPKMRDPYAGGDGSLRTATASGVDGFVIAITAAFIENYMSQFAPSSIIFINGCDLYDATSVWQAFQDKGVAATYSWDKDISLYAAPLSGQFVVDRLAAGDTVAQSLDSAAAANLDTTIALSPDTGEATLKYHFDGNDTLAKALNGATPTPTATDTPTITPTPSPTDVPTNTPTPAKSSTKKCVAHAHKKNGKCVCRTGYGKKHGKCVKKK